MKTEELLAEFIKKAIAVAEKTGDFVINQAPLLLQEFYAWHIWSDVFFIVFGICLILVSRYLPYLWLSKEREFSYENKYFSRYGEEILVPSWFVFIIGSFIGICMLLTNLYDLIYILVAPKLYVIEYFIK